MPSAFGSQSAVSFLPAGSLVDFAGTVAPSGWIMCDGAAISRTVYINLFSAISTAYGSGDGLTTFNLPDYRGRFARYNDNMGTLAGAAGRDVGVRSADNSQTHATAKNGLGASSGAVGGTDGTHTHQNIRTYVNYHSGSANAELHPSPSALGTFSGNATYPLVDSVGSGHGHAGPSITISSTDTETRPINIASSRIIKY